MVSYLHVASHRCAAVSTRYEDLLRRVAQHSGHLDGAVEFGSGRPHLPRVEKLLVRDEPILQSGSDALFRLDGSYGEGRFEAAHDEPAHALNVTSVVEVALQELYSIGAHPAKHKTPAKINGMMTRSRLDELNSPKIPPISKLCPKLVDNRGQPLI